MEQFGNYKITGVVNEDDPYIAVYRATDEQGRAVLLRILQAEIDRDSAAYQRFTHEYRTLNQLKHPGIAPILDSGVVGGKVFYAAAAGRITRPLEEFLRSRSHSFTWREAVDIGRQVAEAVHHIHGHGALHRDIRTTSVYYDPSTDEAVVAEFNLVRNFQLQSLTMQGFQRMALPVPTPEGAKEAPFTVQTDVYLVGNLVYDLVRGKSSPRYRFDYKPLAERGLEVPPALDQVLARALHEEPGGRYPSCEVLAQALRGLL